jgi:hemolysin activation/secretion protein
LSAQTAADAGSLLNQIQRSFPAPKLPEVGPPAALPKVELLPAKGPALTVSAFTFTGNLLIPSERLAPVLAGYVGRPLGFDELRNAAAEISLFYRKEGYVAAVSVPKQEVKGGVVLLKVAESRFGGVSIDAASDGRIDPELIRQVILGAMPPGAPTDMRSLDRGLLLVGDLPGASVTGGLAPGTEEGRSDLVVLSRQTPVWSVSLSADNAGSRSTGSARGLATLAFASPWGHGEAISADLLESEGARYGRVGFALPLGAGGDRLSFGASRMDYDLISPEFAAARLNGEATTLSAEFLRPLARSRVFNVNFTAGVESKGFLNRTAATRVSDYAVRALSLGYNANLYDGLLGGGVNAAQLQWTLGELDLDGSPNQAGVAATTRAEGRYQKLRASLARTQNLAEGWVLVTSVSGQLASKNLDSAEKFLAGGVGAVRAYPGNEGSGDAGYLATVETRWQVSPRWQLSAFADHARVRVNADNAIPGAAAPNELAYHGAGLGLSWIGPAESVWRATWSRRIGDNPNPKPDGSDQDGTLWLDRFWLSVAFQF